MPRALNLNCCWSIKWVDQGMVYPFDYPVIYLSGLPLEPGVWIIEVLLYQNTDWGTGQILWWKFTHSSIQLALSAERASVPSSNLPSYVQCIHVQDYSYMYEHHYLKERECQLPWQVGCWSRPNACLPRHKAKHVCYARIHSTHNAGVGMHLLHNWESEIKYNCACCDYKYLNAASA